jgi:hypothetical protein
VLRLEVGSRQEAGYRAQLLDISGRKVLTLKPGANDVSRLGAGVYFAAEYAAGSRQQSGISKIVIAR